MARDRENDFKLIAMDWVPMHSIIRSAEKCQERDWIFLNWEV